MPPRPALLCILDGWGHRPDHAEDNAIAAAPAADAALKQKRAAAILSRRGAL